MRRVNKNLEDIHVDMYVAGDQTKLSNDAAGWKTSRDLHRTILGQSDVSSAYLQKLDKERDRHDEVLCKSFRNIPVHIRRMVDPDPEESLTIRRWVALPRTTPCTKTKLNQLNRSGPSQQPPRSSPLGHPADGPVHKASTRFWRNNKSYSLGSSLEGYGGAVRCHCANNTSTNSWGSSRTSYPIPLQESHESPKCDCAKNSLANPRRGSFDSDEMFGTDRVPFKCPALSTSRKRNCCIPSRLDSQIALRKAMRSHIEKQRNSTISSHVQFVNYNSLNGTHVGPPAGSFRTKLVTGGHGTDKQLTDQNIELLAILSVQEHNVPMCEDDDLDTADVRE